MSSLKATKNLSNILAVRRLSWSYFIDDEYEYVIYEMFVSIMSSQFESKGHTSVCCISIFEGQTESITSGRSNGRDVVGEFELDGVSSSEGFSKWNAFGVNEGSIQLDFQVDC